MKKSVIIAIFIIYVLAILTVGFIGIAVKPYDEVIKVESIICLNNDAKVNDTDTGGYDIEVSLPKGEQSITLMCEARPENATIRTLSYSSNKTEGVTLTQNKDGTCTVTLSEDVKTVIITVKANDRPNGAVLKIKIKSKISGSDIGIL